MPAAPSESPTNTAFDRYHGPVTMATEESGWWEDERLIFIRERLRRLTPSGGAVLDVGCGAGRILGDAPADGSLRLSVDSFLWPHWTDRPGSLYVVASADALPFRDGLFDVVGSFDVLEHLPDDHGAASEQARVCRSTGSVVAAVPAFPALWSAHDVGVGHLRRYTRPTLRQLFGRAGLTERTSTYFFSFLAGPAWVVRRQASRTGEPLAGAGLVSRVARQVLRVVCAAERLVLRRTSLPVGTSLWSEFSR